MLGLNFLDLLLKKTLKLRHKGLNFILDIFNEYPLSQTAEIQNSTVVPMNCLKLCWMHIGLCISAAGNRQNHQEKISCIAKPDLCLKTYITSYQIEPLTSTGF